MILGIFAGVCFFYFVVICSLHSCCLLVLLCYSDSGCDTYLPSPIIFPFSSSPWPWARRSFCCASAVMYLLSAGWLVGWLVGLGIDRLITSTRTLAVRMILSVLSIVRCSRPSVPIPVYIYLLCAR
ncbi:hypothetical protein BZA05DRAFT_218448 [Tricharina praecox]|uniref:uncharacterized protein n=1 Tax=Tricharina praecox TaxID=43433 RepID=UPI002220FE46|nr:uncharacterized protein BZA05DRAFT_218448 [Tricharina praecox]KAI5855811.1 hypothetical protein BZA05DRAFT_218448 [Tricharina praecox]